MAANGRSYENSCDGNVPQKRLCDQTDSDHCKSSRVSTPGMRTFNTELETTLGEAFSYLFSNSHDSPSDGNMLCPITDTDEPEVLSQTTCLNEQPDNHSDVLQILNNELSSVPKDVFIERLIDLVNRDQNELELLRFELLKKCKTNDHFEHKSAQLKRRYEQRTRTGESLLKKLAKDCFILFRNFQGDTNDDIFDVINISKRHENNTQSQSEQCSGEAQCASIVLRESVARIERDLFSLRGELIQEIECAMNKTNEHAKQHTALTSEVLELKKQAAQRNERYILLQNKTDEQAKQLASFRSEISEIKKQFIEQNEQYKSLQNENKQMKNKINSLQNDLEKQSKENKTILKQTLAEFKKVYDQNKMLRSEFESENKELKSMLEELKHAMKPLQNIPLLVKKLETAQNTLKTNIEHVKKQVDNGCLNIRRLDDEKSSGVSSLKSKVCLINSKVNEIEQNIESMTVLFKSVSTSTTDLRKRLSNVEKGVKCDTTKKTYSEATTSTMISCPKPDAQIDNKSDANVPDDKDSDMVQTSAELPKHNKPTNGIFRHDIDTGTVNFPIHSVTSSSYNDGTASLSQAPAALVTSAISSGTSQEEPVNATTEGGKIGVCITSDQCQATLPMQSEFSGVTRQRITRYYIGGISKSSTETGLRNFLSDRNIKITHLRFFNGENRKSASAQINVPVECREMIENKNFWPKGIYVKPWLSKHKFLSQFNNHTNDGSAEY